MPASTPGIALRFVECRKDHVAHVRLYGARPLADDAGCNRIGVRLRRAVVEVIVAPSRARSRGRDWSSSRRHVLAVAVGGRSRSGSRSSSPRGSCSSTWCSRVRTCASRSLRSTRRSTGVPGWALLLPVAVAVVLVARAPRRSTAWASWRVLLVGSTVVAAAWAVALGAARRHRRPGRLGHAEERVPARRRPGRCAPRVPPRVHQPPRRVPHPRPGPSARLPAVPVVPRPHRPRARAGRRRRSRSSVARSPCRRCWSRCARWRARPGRAPRGPSWPPRRSRSGWRPAPMRCTRASGPGRSRWSSSPPDATIGAATCCALAGGLLFGVLAFLSYGLVLLAVHPARGVAFRRRRARPIAARGASARRACSRRSRSRGSGGSRVSRRPAARYHAGVASRRPYDVFLLVNVGLRWPSRPDPRSRSRVARLRDRRHWWLVGGALAAIGIADAQRDVEGRGRTDLVAVLDLAAPGGRGAGGAADTRRGGWRLQLAFAIGVQTLVRSPW